MRQRIITKYQDEILEWLIDPLRLKNIFGCWYHIKTKSMIIGISYKFSRKEKSFYTKIYMGPWIMSVIWEWIQIIGKNEKYSRRWEKKYILKSISELIILIKLGHYDNRRVYDISQILWKL